VAPDRRCPQCGEPVTPFAAGCAVCGFDLEQWRREQAASPVARARGRVQVPRLSGSTRNDVFLVVVMFVLVAFSPLIGALIVGLIAYGKHRDGDVTMRNVALGFLALDVVAIWAGVPIGLGLLDLLGVF
jgi:hypothetical protein